MAERGWSTDPAGRYRLRWHDGTAWTDQVSDDSGAALVDPAGVPDTAGTSDQLASAWPTQPVSSTPPDEPASANTPQAASPSKVVIWRRGWFLAAVTVVALLIGVGVGGAVTQSQLDDERSTTNAVQKRVRQLRSDLGDVRDELNDREARQEADEARVERIAADEVERDRLAEEAAAEEAAAAAQTAADEAARVEEEATRQAAEQAAAEAQRNTASGSSVYSIGVDINPGR